MRRLSAPALIIGLLLAGPVRADTETDLDVARQLERAFVGVAERVSPAVVTIQVEAYRDQEGIQQSSGSGFIISEDGFILTNNHVVANADRITIGLRDFRSFEAEIVGRDAESDVAVVRIPADGLPVAELGDSNSVAVGQFAVAVGAPYGLEYSVTTGHISGIGRVSETLRQTFGVAYQDFIQTDASINPGNSGGPLLDLDGRVVGINSAVHGGANSIGFAIPINAAKRVAEQLMREGKVDRPYLGVEIDDLEPEIARALGLPVVRGALVNFVAAEGPASLGGLRHRDVILEVGGVEVNTANDVIAQVQTHDVGAEIEFSVWRGGRSESHTVQTASRPDRGGRLPEALAGVESTGPDRTPSRLGLQLHGVTPDENRAIGRQADAPGVFVAQVEPVSLGRRAGLQVGDVIVEVDGREVNSPAELATLLRGIELEYITLWVRRGQETRHFAVYNPMLVE